MALAMKPLSLRSIYKALKEKQPRWKITNSQHISENCSGIPPSPPPLD